MKRIYLLLVCVLASSVILAQKMPFQGRLLNDGKPYNGTATLEFSISDPAWSETKTNVSVQDGYYSVILGETTPLPDTLFSESREVPLNVTVNGEALSAVTLYSPFLPFTGSNPVEIDTLSTFGIKVLGEGDNPKVLIGNINSGYEGGVIIKDSLNNTGAFFQTDGIESTGYTRGYLQLNGRDNAGNLRSAVAAGGGIQGRANSFMDLYGGNSTDDGATLLVDVYAADIDLDGPIPDGYRRGGIDIKNYHGNFTHNIYSEQNGSSAISNMNLVASQDTGEQTYSLTLSSGDGVSTGGSINLTDASGGGSIFLDGTTGTIDAQQILIDGSPIEGSGGGTIESDSIKTRSVHVLGDAGEVKADLNFFASNNSGSLVLNGANDSTKVILGSASGGYGGFLGLYDSIRNIGAQLRVTNKGRGNLYTNNESHVNVGWFGGLNNDGFVQLVSYDSTETFSGAALIGSFVDGRLPEYYLEGSAQEAFGLGRFRVTPLGNSAEETARLEINRSNGGGQATMTIAQDDAGTDPTGSSGHLELWGDGSINFQIGSEGYEDHDLASMNLYGSIDDGGGWWYNSAHVGTRRTGDGTQEYGDLSLHNNEAGLSNLTAYLSGNYAENGGGGLELLDSLGNVKVVLDAGNGALSANNSISINRTDGSSAANLFHDGGDGGGISIQNSADQGTLFFGGNEGVLRVRDAFGVDQVTIDGNSGTIDAQQILVQGVPITSANGNISPDTITTSSIRALNGAGNEGIYLQGNAEGGTLQLSSPDLTNSYNRATFFAGTTSNGENAFANLYGMNPTTDGQELLINNYTTINDVFGSPFTGGYRRGGTDYFDNEGTFLSGIGSNRDDVGGKSGLVLVNSDLTRNAYLSGKWWENANLGILQIFGQNDDGGGLNGTLAVAELQAVDQSGNTSANLSLFNSVSTGTSIETILIQSNNGTGAASIAVNDSSGVVAIDMDGSTGNLTATGTVAADILQSTSGGVQTSDRRLKKNIQSLDNSLENTLKMRGVSYQWKDESKSQSNQIGVIAQEVEVIYPEFVHTNDKGMKAVNYAQMTAVLIEAIKELNAKVQSLEKENSTLKASLSEVETLRKEMDLLMKMLGSSKVASE